MKIAIGSDHAGYNLKEYIKKFLINNKITYKDFGTYSADPVDYPDIARPLAKAIKYKKYDFGILICGSGIGMSMAANKVRRARAAVCTSAYTAKMSREHNNANILCLGSRTTPRKLAMQIIKIFLSTKFKKGRHLRRINKIEPLWY
ncbi:MAG: ribose 5-phosphate isomerase B [Pseudomonadota bacterium]